MSASPGPLEFDVPNARLTLLGRPTLSVISEIWLAGITLRISSSTFEAHRSSIFNSCVLEVQ